MSDQSSKRNLAAAVGAALAGSLFLAGNAQAFDNPFSVKQLEGGYLQVAAKEGSCGENKAEVKAKEGSCGGDKAEPAVTKVKEGNCGEAKCGANKK